MNAGVPKAAPATVSVELLWPSGGDDAAAAARLVRAVSAPSTTGAEGSCLPPSTLASPQSTIRVSLYGPSRTFAGLRSRCRTPRLWA